MTDKTVLQSVPSRTLADFLTDVKAGGPALAKRIVQTTIERVELELSRTAADDPESFSSVLDLPQGWKFRYYDGRWYVAKNVKNRGAPDYKEIITIAAKALGKTPEEVGGEFDSRWLDEVWQAEVQFFLDETQAGLGLEVSVLGRSGGWWGIPFETDMLEVDNKAIANVITSGMKDKKDLVAAYDVAVRRGTENAEEALELYFADALNGVYTLMQDGAVVLAAKVKKDIGGLEKAVEKGVKEFEKPKMWADIAVEQAGGAKKGKGASRLDAEWGRSAAADTSEQFAKEVARTIGGHFIKVLHGGFRYSQKNDSSLIQVRTPDHDIPVWLVISVFDEDGSTRYTPYTSDSLSEIDRFENLVGIDGGDVGDRATIREMAKDIKDDLRTVDKYRESWGFDDEDDRAASRGYGY